MGTDGALYCVGENSGIVLELGAHTGQHRAVVDVGSRVARRIEILPDRCKPYTENREDATLTVADPYLSS